MCLARTSLIGRPIQEIQEDRLVCPLLSIFLSQQKIKMMKEHSFLYKRMTPAKQMSIDCLPMFSPFFPSHFLTTITKQESLAIFLSRTKIVYL
jgi:hypothetical protein